MTDDELREYATTLILEVSKLIDRATVTVEFRRIG